MTGVLFLGRIAGANDMKNKLLIAMLVVLAAGCKAPPPKAPIADTPPPPNLDMPREILDERTWVREQEKGRRVAKTVEWLDVSPQEGVTYLDGTIIVDKIVRNDAEDIYGVKIRLKNLTKLECVVETKVDFFDIRGDRQMGMLDDWRSSDLKPLDFATIENTCKVKGAVGFQLCVRKRGSDGDGVADFSGKTEELPLNPIKPKLPQ